MFKSCISKDQRKNYVFSCVSATVMCDVFCLIFVLLPLLMVGSEAFYCIHLSCMQVSYNKMNQVKFPKLFSVAHSCGMCLQMEFDKYI